MNSFVKCGNLSDIINFMEQDLSDTYNNQLQVLDKLYEMESSDSAITDIPFFLNGTQYHCSKAANSRVVQVYLNNTANSLVSEIDLDSDENDGMWASIDALQADISDACDSTYTMITGLRTVDPDDMGSNVLTKFSSAVSTWMGGAGAMAREAYSAMVDVLATGVDCGATVVNWLLDQYNSVANATANDTTGELEFHDTNFHVQGFAGSYALQVGFTIVSTVLTTVITIISPIIGIIVGGIASGIRALFGLIPDKSDTYAVEKEAANNVFAVPIFQGEIAKTYLATFLEGDNPDNANYFSLLQQNRSMTLRMAGWVLMLYLEPGDLTIKYEAFISCDFVGYPSPSLYSYESSSSSAYTDSAPYIDYINDVVLAGRSLTCDNKPTENALCDLLFMQCQCVGANGYASYTDQVNDWVGSAASLSVSDAQQYANNALRASICMSLMTLIWIRAVRSISVVDPTYTLSIPGKNSTDQDWLNYFAGCLKTHYWPSWAQLVNTIIPNLRAHMAASSGYGSGAGTLASLGSYYNTLSDSFVWHRNDYPYQMTNGIMRINKFRWLPPKYSNSARATTIALAVTAAVVVTAAVIVKFRIKQRMRNKQIERYRKVQQDWNRYMETGSAEDLKTYKKSIKKYNFWSGFSGTSRLSGISGWESGDDSKTPSAPASWSGYTGSSKYEQQNADCPSINLSEITRNLAQLDKLLTDKAADISDAVAGCTSDVSEVVTSETAKVTKLISGS